MSLIRLMGGEDGPTAFLLSDLVYKSSVSIVGNVTNIQCMKFSLDGTKLYISDASSTLRQYALSSAWDITTATYTASKAFPTNIYGFSISSDGTKLYTPNSAISNYGQLIQYTISTAWDITTINTNNVVLMAYTAQTTANIGSISFSSDGTKMYLQSGSIYQYNLSTPWVISSAVYSATKSLAGGTKHTFSTNGALVYVMDTGFIVSRYILSTAWSISSAAATAAETKDLSVKTTNSTTLAWGDNGKFLYVGDSEADVIEQYEII